MLVQKNARLSASKKVEKVSHSSNDASKQLLETIQPCQKGIFYIFVFNKIYEFFLYKRNFSK